MPALLDTFHISLDDRHYLEMRIEVSLEHWWQFSADYPLAVEHVRLGMECWPAFDSE